VVERKRLQPKTWAYSKDASFAQGVEVGEAIYVSGQAALDENGKLVGLGDMRAQSRQTFTNIATVLAEAGAAMDDVVKITAFITDVSKYAEYTAIRKETFPRHLPASTTVAVSALVLPGLLVEVEAVAIKGSGRNATRSPH